MTNLTIDQMEKIAERWNNATPDQIMAIAQKMAEERPDLLAVVADPTDRARGLIQLEMNNPDRNIDYIRGVVDGLWFAQLITDDERKTYHNQLNELSTD